MAAVGHDIDVSAVDQTALACFLTCDFAQGLQGKSLGGQSGSKRSRTCENTRMVVEGVPATCRRGSHSSQRT